MTYFGLTCLQRRLLSGSSLQVPHKKDVSQMSSCRQWGLSEMAHFIFGYFSTKLGTSVGGHETIIM
jgi:hypothetical protein